MAWYFGTEGLRFVVRSLVLLVCLSRCNPRSFPLPKKNHGPRQGS